MKAKTKIFISIIVIVVVLIAISAIWFFYPKTFLSGVEPADISSISVFDGNTGKSFVIEDLDEISHIVENIHSNKMVRNKTVGRVDGFCFSMIFYNSNGEEIDSFIINSENTIRDDSFFYRCDGGLCFDYLKELEDKYVK